MTKGIGKRILLTTYGSFGDVHPYVAIARELKRREHRPLVATSGIYREKFETLGIDFRPLSPDLPDPREDLAFTDELMRQAMHPMKGGQYIIETLMLPYLRASYEELKEAAQGADMLVTHMLSFAGHILAEKTGIPWASSVLAPLNFFSVHNASIPPFAPSLAPFFASLPVNVNRVLRRMMKRMTDKWMRPVQELRRELGLRPSENPIFEGQHSPDLVLALFSKVMMKPQPDWPQNVRVTGFCFYDKRDEVSDAAGLQPELREFLDAGPPPIVFTLGSSAVFIGKDFFRESIEAAKLLKRRAVLLIGDARNLPKEPLPEGIAAFEYAPYSEILPRASVIVHQGGVGTTGQALRAGRPMLVIPFSHDQPDNAWRVMKLGVARMITRKSYTAARAAKELSILLDDETYARRAAEVGRIVQSEKGVATACDLLLQYLDAKTAAPDAREENLVHAGRI